MNQSPIPTAYRAWCHYCDVGFLTAELAKEHFRKNLAIHSKIVAIRTKLRMQQLGFELEAAS